ncbi:MAG: radical SAM protein [Bdellovibrionales bacterium]
MSLERNDAIKINEIFHSIQGESSFTGFPTVFVRTSGCHLRCTYCDTQYAYHEGDWWAPQDLLKKVLSYSTRHVCVTGGEPLLQPLIPTFLKSLCDHELVVSLETSGDRDCEAVDPRVRKIIDVKTPDSGEPDRFCRGNLRYANWETEFKFVICSEKDFGWAENFAKENKLFEKTNVLYSPSFKKISERWLAEKILSQRSSARLQVQLHKYIWPETERGV